MKNLPAPEAGAGPGVGASVAEVRWVASAVTHAHEAVSEAIALTLPNALARLDDPTLQGYLAMLKKALPQAAWEHLENLVMQQRVSFANVPISPVIDKVRLEARNEGRQEGRQEGEARAILTLFEARGIPVSEAVRDRIMSCTDLPTLDRWVRRAATASTAAAVVRPMRTRR